MRTYTVDGISTPGQTYRFIVRAVNIVGASSNSAQYSIIGATVPNPPTSFIRNNLLTTKSQVAFSWTAPTSNGGSSVSEYSIERMDNDSYILVTTGLTATSYIQTGLSAGTSYSFRVKARNAVGFSSYSTVFTIIAATVPS